jgi:hypothetical protein
MFMEGMGDFERWMSRERALERRKRGSGGVGGVKKTKVEAGSSDDYGTEYGLVQYIAGTCGREGS